MHNKKSGNVFIKSRNMILIYSLFIILMSSLGCGKSEEIEKISFGQEIHKGIISVEFTDISSSPSSGGLKIVEAGGKKSEEVMIHGILKNSDTSNFKLSRIEFSQESGGLKMTTPFIFYEKKILPPGGTFNFEQFVNKINNNIIFSFTLSGENNNVIKFGPYCLQ